MRKKILVVDEAQCILKLFRELLEEEGYEAILSPCPIQKAQDVEDIKPDLIIIEFIFNCKNLGWPMLQMLKTHCPTSRIPIIVCTTAMETIREQHEYLTLQGIPIVYKPFEVNDLLGTVEQLFVLSEVALHTWEYKVPANPFTMCLKHNNRGLVTDDYAWLLPPDALYFSSLLWKTV